MREHWRRVARVARAHGKRGELVVTGLDGSPAPLREGMRVVAVPPDDVGSRELLVSRCARSGDAAMLVALEGVRAIDEASALVGRYLLVRETDLPDGWVLHSASHLMGREVEDVRLGGLGRIDEVLYGSAQDVWVVRGPLGEVLVPAVAEIVLHLPREGSIVTELPRGLAPWDCGNGWAS